MTRPTCKRCGGPLDFFFDPQTCRQEWCCNNPNPMRTTDEHEKAWRNLPGDDVVHLESMSSDATTDSWVQELIWEVVP